MGYESKLTPKNIPIINLKRCVSGFCLSQWCWKRLQWGRARADSPGREALDSDTATTGLCAVLECRPLWTPQVTDPSVKRDSLALFFHSGWHFLLLNPSFTCSVSGKPWFLPSSLTPHSFPLNQDGLMRIDPDLGCCQYSCDRTWITTKGGWRGPQSGGWGNGSRYSRDILVQSGPDRPLSSYSLSGLRMVVRWGWDENHYGQQMVTVVKGCCQQWVKTSVSPDCRAWMWLPGMF